MERSRENLLNYQEEIDRLKERCKQREIEYNSHDETKEWVIIRASLDLVKRLEVEEGQVVYDEQIRAFIAAHPKNKGKIWFNCYGHDNKGKGVIVEAMAEHNAEALKNARLKRPDCKFNHCNI